MIIKRVYGSLLMFCVGLSLTILVDTIDLHLVDEMLTVDACTAFKTFTLR